MGKEHVCVPKGVACGLNQAPEYDEGIEAARNNNSKNPYDFFDNFEKYYAWDIGHQVGKRDT